MPDRPGFKSDPESEPMAPAGWVYGQKLLADQDQRHRDAMAYWHQLAQEQMEREAQRKFDEAGLNPAFNKSKSDHDNFMKAWDEKYAKREANIKAGTNLGVYGAGNIQNAFERVFNSDYTDSDWRRIYYTPVDPHHAINTPEANADWANKYRSQQDEFSRNAAEDYNRDMNAAITPPPNAVKQVRRLSSPDELLLELGRQAGFLK